MTALIVYNDSCQATQPMLSIIGNADHSYFHDSIQPLLLPWFFIGFRNKQGWIFIPALFITGMLHTGIVLLINK